MQGIVGKKVDIFFALSHGQIQNKVGLSSGVNNF